MILNPIWNAAAPTIVGEEPMMQFLIAGQVTDAADTLAHGLVVLRRVPPAYGFGGVFEGVRESSAPHSTSSGAN
jgi:hypothetical protein